MGEKDITEKSLEAYNDVFADIINVLLFQGKQVVHENELSEGTARTHYKSDGKLHEMERDVSKFWKSVNGDIRIALYGLENQTAIDKDMPLRVIGYDGTGYREQLLKDGTLKDGTEVGESKTAHKKQRYPVITLVLYFGNKKWDGPLTLSECMDIPKELVPFFNDYRVNLFEISRLTDEQLSLFKSDFRIVADYFVQRRKNLNYVPAREIMHHVHAVFEIMAALTRDNRFEEEYNKYVEKVKNGNGRSENMEKFLDNVENRGMEKATCQCLKNLMKTTGLSLNKAMDMLDIPDEARSHFERILQKEQEKE